MHGAHHKHMCAGSYADSELRWWAERTGEWQAHGKDVDVYFNNDGEGNAVRNAASLKNVLTLYALK
jgi:uncharacterized protein YecE (DUF72 family)